eukprot:COSAG02_NODE_2440_length_8858_cov_73.811965_5_plen_122_part_00
MCFLAGRVSVGKMGVIQGGGQWPNRLGKRCLEMIGEVGEDVIYDMYVQSSESGHREVEKPEEEYAVMFRCELCKATSSTLRLAPATAPRSRSHAPPTFTHRIMHGVTQASVPRGRSRRVNW